MKFNPKHAFIAVALAAAGQANAQLMHDSSGTGNSSMFFVALDEIAGRSYFSELVANAGSTTTGILHMDDLVNNSQTGHWTVTLTDLSTFTAGSATLDNISGGFGGADTNATVGGGTSLPTGSRRLVTSISEGAATPAFTNSQVGSSGAGGVNVSNFVAQASGQCPNSPCIATNPSQAGFAGISNGTAGIGLQWGFPSGPSLGDAFSGTIAWDIYLVVTASNTLSLPANATQLALHAVLDLATNILTISGPPSTVPLPAAVWLLGSAALGLVGIGRRRKGQGFDLANGAVAA